MQGQSLKNKVNAFRLNKTLFLQIKIRRSHLYRVPIPAALRSKVWVCGRAVPWDCGFKTRRGLDGSLCCVYHLSPTWIIFHYMHLLRTLSTAIYSVYNILSFIILHLFMQYSFNRELNQNYMIFFLI